MGWWGEGGLLLDLATCHPLGGGVLVCVCVCVCVRVRVCVWIEGSRLARVFNADG